MRITAKPMGILKDVAAADETLDLPDNATIADVLAHLQIPSDHVHVCTVNGNLVQDRGFKLSEGDELMILPPVVGG